MRATRTLLVVAAILGTLNGCGGSASKQAATPTVQSAHEKCVGEMLSYVVLLATGSPPESVLGTVQTKYGVDSAQWRWVIANNGVVSRASTDQGQAGRDAAMKSLTADLQTDLGVCPSAGNGDSATANPVVEPAKSGHEACVQEFLGYVARLATNDTSAQDEVNTKYGLASAQRLWLISNYAALATAVAQQGVSGSAAQSEVVRLRQDLETNQSVCPNPDATQPPAPTSSGVSTTVSAARRTFGSPEACTNAMAKVLEKSLPFGEPVNADFKAAIAHPQTPTEVLLAVAWSGYLEHSPPQIGDDYFLAAQSACGLTPTPNGD